jgi:hypothetical protein
MPVNAPSDDFMVKGGASFVATTISFAGAADRPCAGPIRIASEAQSVKRGRGSAASHRAD